MNIRELFGLAPKSAAADTGETHTVRKVVEELDQLPAEQARFIAAFGYILGRVANADSHISPEESRAMELILRAYLPESQALIVLQTAKLHNQLFGATENFLVTREFKRIATREQKLALLDCLFRVSAEEDDISSVEDNEIRQIASELGLEHHEYIAVRAAWVKRLQLMRDLPQGPSKAEEES